MTLLKEVPVKCPNCKAKSKFITVEVVDCYGLTTDLQPICRGGSLSSYRMHTCPDCGFTGERDDFRSSKVEPGLSEKIDQHLRPRLHGDRSGERSDLATRWEFAALIAEWQNKDALAIADLYRKAAWFAAKDDQTAQALDYRRKAANWLERALATDPPDRPHILYLIGELYRRCGEKNLADTWFEAAIEAAAAAQDDWLKDLAIQQKTNPQEGTSFPGRWCGTGTPMPKALQRKIRRLRQRTGPSRA